MQKLDDKDAKALLEIFLNQAFVSIVRDLSYLQKVMNKGAGFRLNNGITFLVEAQMQLAEGEIVSLLVSRLGPQLGHYKEIADALWNVAAKGFSEGALPTDSALAASCFSKVYELAGRAVQFIHPAYNVALVDEVKEIHIGPVALRCGVDAVNRLSKHVERITFVLGDSLSGQSCDGFEYKVSETMWDIKISSSEAARFEHASWMTCIATSLIRLLLDSDKWGTLPPYYADVENQPFDRHKMFSEHICVGANGSFNLGGGKAGRLYELGRGAKDVFSHQATKDRISLIFEPSKKSLAERFSQGLGWLAKGRQAQDRSDRFLFFFTALEALLSLDDKSSPVVQTIARHAAVLWSNEITDRINISKKIRNLYETRSALVHTGRRSVRGLYTYLTYATLRKIISGVIP